MRHIVLVAALAPPLVACGRGNDAMETGAGSGAPGSPHASMPAPAPDGPTPTPTPADGGSDAGPPATAASQGAPARSGHDFTETAKLLFVVGACGDGRAPAEYSAAIEEHCKIIRKIQHDYRDNWFQQARAFFAEKVPPSIPKQVVYPFGGHLLDALAVYPDADEITTMSLEPAGGSAHARGPRGGRPRPR